jgi:hypothetical protein
MKRINPLSTANNRWNGCHPRYRWASEERRARWKGIAASEVTGTKVQILAHLLVPRCKILTQFGGAQFARRRWLRVGGAFAVWQEAAKATRVRGTAARLAEGVAAFAVRQVGGAIKALLRLYSGCIKPLLSLY